eukprot:687167-Pelagomonas_calceolata.AAC.3
MLAAVMLCATLYTVGSSIFPASSAVRSRECHCQCQLRAWKNNNPPESELYACPQCSVLVCLLMRPATNVRCPAGPVYCELHEWAPRGDKQPSTPGQPTSGTTATKGKAPATPNAYALFVKEHMSTIKSAHPKGERVDGTL